MANAPKPCKLFIGGLTKAGYGLMTRDGKRVYAHRAAWEDSHGPIPEGLEVCHECDTPACVEVSHLFIGTHKDNMHDMLNKGRNSVIGSIRLGSKHPASKLVETAVVWMRYLRSLGATHKRIAEIVGGSTRNAATVCSNKTWKHVAEVL